MLEINDICPFTYNFHIMIWSLSFTHYSSSMYKLFVPVFCESYGNALLYVNIMITRNTAGWY